MRIGCALLPKKVSRYLTPQVKEIAAANGIELCIIDPLIPLTQQGPFDAIIHKLRPSKAWEQNLLQYLLDHPNVKVIDRVDGIKTLQNRATMLTPLRGMGVELAKPQSCSDVVRIQAPPQVEILEGMALPEVEAKLASAGLHPPLLVKPLWTDGREGSHRLAVLHDLKSLELLLSEGCAQLKPPVVVQQFVHHGGVLFKVYVLGMQTFVTRRPSLGPTYLREDKHNGFQPVGRISCQRPYVTPPKPVKQEEESEQPSPGSEDDNSSSDKDAGDTTTPTVEQQQQCMPPLWVTDGLASLLRRRLGMQLFNFDLIRPESQDTDQCLYYVVDINYFPGVDKIPGFEQLFVDFLVATCAADQVPQAWPQPAPQQQHPLPLDISVS